MVTTLLIADAIAFLNQEKNKERACHVQFVRDIALELQERYGGDRLVVEVAAILHDIGRDKEEQGEHHSQSGPRIAKEFLLPYSLPEGQLSKILRCIENHGGELPIETIEEEILISADSASKIVNHTNFMLMCKKPDFVTRAERGMKYLEKGISKIRFDEYKKEILPHYYHLKKLYEQTLQQKN